MVASLSVFIVSAIFSWNCTGWDWRTAVPWGIPTSFTFTFAIRTNRNWGLETVQFATTPTTPLFPPAATLVMACWLLVLLLSTSTTLPWCWWLWYLGVVLFNTKTRSPILRRFGLVRSSLPEVFCEVVNPGGSPKFRVLVAARMTTGIWLCWCWLRWGGWVGSSFCWLGCGGM